MNVLRIGRVIPGVALLCLLSACGSNNSAYYDNASSADSTSYSIDGTVSQAQMESKDPAAFKTPEGNLLVRKAAMNFKVNELQKTSQGISSVAALYGGEVWNSHIQTSVQSSITKKVSPDSLLEVITYRQTNDLTIRVPSKNLDSLLVKLEAFSTLLHDKEVTTENVSLEYLSNELKANNMSRVRENHDEALEQKKSNLEKYTSASFENASMQNEVIDRKINNLALMDKVAYSTVKVSIYQDDIAYKNMLPNLQADRFEPAFYASALMALGEGWDFLLTLIVFLLKIWPLYLAALVGYFIVRLIEKNRLVIAGKKIIER